MHFVAQQVTAVTNATDRLLNYGVLGPLLVLSLFYIYKLSQKLEEALKAQTQIAQAFSDKLIALNDRMRDVVQSNVSALENNTRATTEAADELRTLSDNLLRGKKG